MTWRAPDELVARVRRAANQRGSSINEFVTRVLDAATDPELTDDESLRVRERLAAAGLLAPVGPPQPDRPETILPAPSVELARVIRSRSWSATAASDRLR